MRSATSQAVKQSILTNEMIALSKIEDPDATLTGHNVDLTP